MHCAKLLLHRRTIAHLATLAIPSLMEIVLLQILTQQIQPAMILIADQQTIQENVLLVIKGTI